MAQLRTTTGPAGPAGADGAAGADPFTHNYVTFPANASAYIDCGHDPLSDMSAPFTWELWLRMPTTFAGGSPLSGLNGATSGWAIALSSGTPYGALIGSDGDVGTNTGSQFSATNIHDGYWHHIAMIWDPADQGFVWYIDGVESLGAAGGTNPVDTLNTTVVEMYIGSLTGMASFFTGDVAAVRISSVARYTNGVAFATAPPLPTEMAEDSDTVALFLFPEGSGSTTTPTGTGGLGAAALHNVTWGSGQVVPRGPKGATGAAGAAGADGAPGLAFAKNGAIDDSDFETPVDGLTGIDIDTDTFYVRSNGAWKTVSLS